MKKLILFIFIIFAIVSTNVKADVIVSNKTGINLYYNLGSRQWYGTRFTAPYDLKLTGILLNLSKVNAPNQVVVVTFKNYCSGCWSSGDTLSSGKLLLTVTGFQDYIIPLSSGYTFISGNQYGRYVGTTGGSPGVVNMSRTTGTYLEGLVFSTSNTGSTWGFQPATIDLYFEIYGIPSGSSPVETISQDPLFQFGFNF